MKKFLLTYHGMWEMKPEIMDAWQVWFAAIGEHIVDQGNPLGNAHEVTHDGVVALTAEGAPAVGYSIVSADDIDHALKLVADCPIIDSVRVYEAMSM